MLTRHFYETDEVCLCLQNALRRRRPKEAVFWASELLLSHEFTLLDKTMIQTWIVYLGAPCVHWLDSWMTVGEDIGGCQRLVLVAEFSKLVEAQPKRKAPPPLQCFVMAARGSSVASPTAVSEAVMANDAFGVYWNLGELKPIDMISALRGYVDSPEIFDSLFIAAKTVGRAVQTLLAATAVQVLCLDEYPPALTCSTEVDVAGWLREWESTIGRRAGRRYEIDCEALPGRARVTQKEGLLGSAIQLLERGCQFWQTTLAIIKDDMSLENVVDEHFPDDIPDEWSVVERSKSHPVEASVLKKRSGKMADVMVSVWGFSPVIRKTWNSKLKQLFDSVGVVP